MSRFKPTAVTRAGESELRNPRIQAPRGLDDFCSVERYERLLHSYGKSFFDSARIFARDFSNPPDVIAFPRSEAELVSTLAWCDSTDAVVIPWGGGSSVVAGFAQTRTRRPTVSW